MGDRPPNPWGVASIPTPGGSLPSPFLPLEELAAVRKLARAGRGLGREAKGLPGTEEAAWACAACVFQSPTLETVAQSEQVQLLENQKAAREEGDSMCEQRALGNL